MLAGVEDDVSAEHSHYTQPEEVEDFVKKTGVDSLAISIGTSHGATKFKPEQCTRNADGVLVPPDLRFDILEEIEKRIPGFPIVLHGSSSVPAEHVKHDQRSTAASSRTRSASPRSSCAAPPSVAVCKINIDSDGRLAMTAAIRKVVRREARRVRSAQVPGPGPRRAQGALQAQEPERSRLGRARVARLDPGMTKGRPSGRPFSFHPRGQSPGKSVRAPMGRTCERPPKRPLAGRPSVLIVTRGGAAAPRRRHVTHARSVPPPRDHAGRVDTPSVLTPVPDAAAVRLHGRARGRHRARRGAIGPGAAPPTQDAPVDEARPADKAPRIEGRVEQETKTQMAVAQERERTLRRRARLVPHYEYLEDSYLNYFLPRVGPAGDRPLAFEAQAAAHLFLVNQWEKVEHVSSPGSMASVWSWDVSFLLRLRMVQDRSAPVRPPSYMPATHLQWFGLWKTSGGSVQELEAELGLTHHSNGQQQCSFVPTNPDNNQQDNASPTECLDPGTVHGSLRHNLNYRSGDFSTSYGTVGLHYAFMTLDRDRFMAARGSMGVQYQQNFVSHDGPFGGFPGAMERDQAWMYGIHRIKVEAQGRWRLGPPWTDSPASSPPRSRTS